MFTRSILLPTLAACVIAAPFLFSNANESSRTAKQNPSIDNLAGYGGFGNSRTVLPSAQFDGPNASNVFRQTGLPTNFQNAPTGNPAFYGGGQFANPPANPALTSNSMPGTGPGNPVQTIPWNQSAATMPQNATSSDWPSAGNLPNLPGLTPDWGASRTLVFPGDANGPDLSQPPMEFIPVFNFEEVFRFDVSRDWIKQRWRRVSTNPGAEGLHGLRVALVTGTNSWDLHGSLTYFFDQKQQVQRITFRGWTGDATQLVKVLTEEFNFKTQPTHWAGLYKAKSWGRTVGGLLMKDPDVIYSDNPVQKVALMLEINNPSGKFSLSEEFQSFIKGSQTMN